MRGVLRMLAVLAGVGVGMAQPAFEHQATLPLGPLSDMVFGDSLHLPRKDTLFIAQGSGVVVYVRDTTTMEFVKVGYFPRTSVDRAQSLEYDSARRKLYLATDRALEIWDVQNPENPVLLHRTLFSATSPSPYVTILAWDPIRHILGVGIPYWGLLFYDLSNPAQPALLSSVSLSVAILELAFAGTMAYVAAEFSGLYPVDLTDPQNPSVGTPLQPGGSVTSVVTHPDLGVVALANPLSGEVALYTLSLTPLHTMSFTGWVPSHLALWGSYLFVTDMSGALWRFDISTPTQPVDSGKYTTDPQHPPRKVAVENSHRVVIDYWDFTVDEEYDFRYGTQQWLPTWGNLQSGTALSDPLVDNEVTITVGENGDGAGTACDLLQVGSYTLRKFREGPSACLPGINETMDFTFFFAVGNKQSSPLKVLLARGGNNLPWHLAVATVDSAQVSVDTLGLPGYPISVAGNPTYAYVGDNSGNLYVVNHTTSPMTLLNTVAVPTRFIVDMDLQDTLLAMALSDSGLALYALGDSVNLQLETYLSGHPVDNVRLRDSLLFALGGSSGAYDVRIYRVQAGTLTLLSQLTDPYTRYLDADRAGNVLFVIREGTYEALQAYDISDPTQPIWLASLDLSSIPRNVRAFPDGTVMVWTRETGIHAFYFPYVGVGESGPPIRRVRVQAGRKVLRLILDRPGRVRVFNALGREVIRRWVPASRVLVQPLRPGLYFWRLDMEGGHHEKGRVWVLP